MAIKIALHDEKAQEFLSQAIEKTKKIHDGDKAYYGVLSAVIFRDVVDHFTKEMGPEGAWREWSPMYRIYMESLGKRGGNKILQDSGRLRQAFTPTNYRKVAEGVLWYNNAQTESGFPYAAAHDEGGPKLPARTFMWASEEALENISELTLKFILDA